MQSQVASAGATVEAAPVTLAPGGTAVMQITARAAGGAVQGDNFGFVLLRRGSDVRRIPYAFSVSRSSLTGAPVAALKTFSPETRAAGEDRASVYRWPTSPFSILGIFGVDPSVNDDGKEKVYSLDIKKQAVNAGVVVVRPETKLDASITALLSSNQPIHPWFMGSLDENDVLGYAGIPVNVNGQLPDFLYSVGAAGGVFLPPGPLLRLRRLRTRPLHRSLARRSLHAALVGQRRQAADRQGHHEGALERAADDRRQGHRCEVGRRPARAPALLRANHAPNLGRRVDLRSGERASQCSPFPAARSRSTPGTQFMQLVASDYQEGKNINTESDSPLPNTRFQGLRAEAVPRPTVTWVTPEKGKCAAARQRLLVVANDNVQISSVGFFDGKRADRPRSQERRRSLRDDLAHDRQAQGRARAHGRRVGRARARGRGDSGRSRLQVIAATRFGKPLPDGGTIGVAAAASPYDSRSDVLRGVEWWEARGYKVKLADGVWDRDDYVAGDARRRGEDLNALFADPEVDVVQALQGGFGSAQAIPYLDFDLIAANPKPLVGYSDITALHVAIRQRAGVATVYGNGLMGVGAVETTAFTKDRLLDVLRTGGAGEVPHDPDDPWVRTLHGGRVTAPLVGGCLWLLMQTMGTPWEMELDGAILFFEDTHTPPYYLDGHLVQLAHAGKLEQVAGVVVGQLEKSDYGDLRPVSDWARSRTIEDVLEERLGSLGVPAIYGLPLGHTKHLAALPLGVTCTLDADAKTLTVDEPALR